MPSGSFVSGVVHGKYDKSMHFTVSFIATMIVVVLLPFYWALGTVFSIGIAKEIKDSLKPSDHFDIGDVLTNTIGIVLAAVVWRVII